MTSRFPDELISAYLDGELTAEEEGRVEQRLHEDAKLQRMFHELRALRSTLQSIPATDPPEDLAERVLRQAERRMLLGEEETSQEHHDNDTFEAPVPDTNSPSPVVTKGTPRHKWRLAIPVLATAAALLVAAAFLFEPIRFFSDPTVATSFSNKATSADPENELREPAGGNSARTNVDIESAEEAEHTTFESLDAAEERAPDETRELPAADQQPPDASHGNATAGTEMEQSSKRRVGIAGGRGPSVGRGAGAYKAEIEPPADGGRADAGADPSALAVPVPSHRGGRAASERPSLAADALPGNDAEESLDGKGKNSRFRQRDLASGRAEGGRDLQAADSQEASSPAPVPGGPRNAEAVADSMLQEDKARAVAAQRLVNQLDDNQRLLVEVSLPPAAEAQLLETNAGAKTNGRAWNAAARELLGVESRAQLELRVASPDEHNLLAAAMNQPIENVILVEGTKEEVRASLLQLAGRSDVQVSNVALAPRRPRTNTAKRTEPLARQPTDRAASEDRPASLSGATKNTTGQAEEVQEPEPEDTKSLDQEESKRISELAKQLIAPLMQRGPPLQDQRADESAMPKSKPTGKSAGRHHGQSPADRRAGVAAEPDRLKERNSGAVEGEKAEVDTADAAAKGKKLAPTKTPEKPSPPASTAEREESRQTSSDRQTAAAEKADKLTKDQLSAGNESQPEKENLAADSASSLPGKAGESRKVIRLLFRFTTTLPSAAAQESGPAKDQ